MIMIYDRLRSNNRDGQGSASDNDDDDGLGQRSGKGKVKKIYPETTDRDDDGDRLRSINRYKEGSENLPRDC